MKVAVTGDACTVQTPYHPDLPRRFRQLGGRWDAIKKVWSFDARDAGRVQEICNEFYGADDEPTVDITVDLDKLDRRSHPRYEPLKIGGMTLVERRWRDGRVDLYPGVVVLKGGFPRSGGSRAAPSWEPEDGTVLEVRDVPKSLAERFVTANPDAATMKENEQ